MLGGQHKATPEQIRAVAEGITEQAYRAAFEGIRRRNIALKAELAQVIQPEHRMQNLAFDIDLLLNENNRLRELVADLLKSSRHSDRQASLKRDDE